MVNTVLNTVYFDNMNTNLVVLLVYLRPVGVLIWLLLLYISYILIKLSVEFFFADYLRFVFYLLFTVHWINLFWFWCHSSFTGTLQP